MVAHKFPPKGYDAMEYPLPHNFDYQFGLSPEVATKNSTIIPLITAREDCNAADTVEVNPSNSTFAEETGATVQPDSIIPKMNIAMTAQFNSVLDETDKIRYLKFHWMPLYLAFADMYTAIDNETDVEVEDILELIHIGASKHGGPLYNDVKLIKEEDWPVSTVNFTDTFTTLAMATDLKGEGVTFDPNLMWDALSYYSNGRMLSKAMGNWNTVTLDVRKPWQMFSNNFTNPTVKRGNEYTFCGILFHVPLTSTVEQFYTSADVTEASAVINFDVRVRYDEWNHNFDQTAF